MRLGLYERTPWLEPEQLRAPRELAIINFGEQLTRWIISEQCGTAFFYVSTRDNHSMTWWRSVCIRVAGNCPVNEMRKDDLGDVLVARRHTLEMCTMCPVEHVRYTFGRCQLALQSYCVIFGK